MNDSADRSLQFMAGGGKVGALMRMHDWTGSPLGRPRIWPQSLRSVVGLLLESRFPMFVAWGKELGFLYNDAYAEILGAKHPRALGGRFCDIWPEIWLDISPLIASAMAGEATYRADLPLTMNRRGFDEQTWFTFSYSPVRDEDGAVAGIFCAVAETTQKIVAEKALRASEEALRVWNVTLENRVTEALAERRQAEEALRRAQKLESLGQLTGGVAHDFNNLLAVMSGGVHLLERQTDPAQRARIVAGMRHAVKRGAALTRHLLSFSRQRPLNPEAVDLRRQIEGMREILTRSLRGDIDIDMRFDDGIWPVEVDAGELELALINLCVNARDAILGKGKIRIAAHNRPGFSLGELTGDFVELAISDTGAGIPADMLSRVFDPFFTTKEVGKGSGLGLAQVYGFVKQSGGYVDIQSETAKGTSVRLFLPRTRKSPEIQAQGDVTVATADGQFEGHILLVEDDNEVAALAAEMLKSIGFGVTRVAGATAALGALANDRAVNLVFSDIMMPGGMSGVELAREIKKRRPELPVLLATGYQEAAAGAAKDGIGVLLKPYTMEDLATALRSQLRAAWRAEAR
jgi:signal transduction histidine kinase/ActR/RegA family two-component response regulator